MGFTPPLIFPDFQQGGGKTHTNSTDVILDVLPPSAYQAPCKVESFPTGGTIPISGGSAMTVPSPTLQSEALLKNSALAPIPAAIGCAALSRKGRELCQEVATDVVEHDTTMALRSMLLFILCINFVFNQAVLLAW